MIQTSKVLENATNVFWQKGYFNTSVNDLVSKTHLNRAQLYGKFQDKEGLFKACLEWYRKHISQPALAPLKHHNIAALKAFYQQFLMPDHYFVDHGCLLMITAANAPLHSEMINQVVEEFIQYLSDQIDHCLKQIPMSDTHRAQYTAMFVGHTVGLMSLQRLPRCHTLSDQQVQGILTVLNSLEKSEYQASKRQ